MRVRTKLLAAATAVALVAGACGGGDDDVDAGESTSPTEAPEGTDAPPATDAPSGTDAPPEATDAPPPLPASARGVTENGIKVGVAVPDFDALQAAGIANYQGDAEIAFQAFIDVINAEGGISGRQIEPVYVDFNFVDPLTQEQACTRLVEDEEVFIVLYGLLRDANLCLTELNDTMVMTRSFQSADLREKSGDTLWLQLNANDDERSVIMGQAIAEAGRLDGRTVGIITPAGDNDGLQGRTLQDALAEMGIESTLLKTEAAGGDPIARDNELRLFAERFRVEGVDFVFDLWGGGNIAGVFAGVGYTPDFAYLALGASVDGAEDRSLLDGAISASELNEQAMLDDADFQANCMDVVRNANPELADEMAFLPTGDQQADGVPNWVNPVMIACDHTRLLKLLGEIAGADLTNESFLAALDELGPVDLYGYGQASFRSADKWDGLDEFHIQEYDFETDSIQIVGDPIVVDR